MTSDPSSRTTRELLADWAAIMRQLRAGRIITVTQKIRSHSDVAVVEVSDAALDG